MRHVRGNRNITYIIADVITLLVTCLLFFSYYWSKDQTKYFLFSAVALSVVVFLLHIFKRNSKIPVSLILTIVSAVFYSLVFLFNIPSLIIFISSLLFAFYVYDKGLDEVNIKMILVCCALLSIHAVYMSTLPASKYPYNNALILAYENPNMTGIILSNIAIILTIGAFYFKKTSTKVMFGLLAIVMGYLVILTDSRASILTIIVFALLLLLYRKGKMINKKIRTLLILFPFLFIILYSVLLEIIPYDAMLFNKRFFSGREILWQHTIRNILADPFSIESYESGGLNLVLTGFYQFGVVAIVSYFVFLFSMKPKFTTGNKLTYQQVAYMGFLCVFLQQAFEGTLISGSYAIYIFSYIMLGISSIKREEVAVE